MTPKPRSPVETIGVVTLDADGTLRLQLRAEGPEGVVGDGFLVYGPTHRDYAMVLRHVEAGEPLRVGETRHVAPWPSEPGASPRAWVVRDHGAEGRTTQDSDRANPQTRHGIERAC